MANPKSRTLWSGLSGVLVISSSFIAVFLLLGWYYLIQQKEVWQARLNQEKQQLEAKERESDAYKEELGQVKRDLEKYAERIARESRPLVELSTTDAFEVIVIKSQTVTSPDLRITLTETIFLPNPPRYVVTAKITFRDLADMQLRNAEEGSVVTYPKEHGYNIGVLKADSVSAKFRITRNR